MKNSSINILLLEFQEYLITGAKYSLNTGIYSG